MRFRRKRSKTLDEIVGSKLLHLPTPAERYVERAEIALRKAEDTLTVLTVITKGSDEIPAKNTELQALSNTAKATMDGGIVVGDHRLVIEKTISPESAAWLKIADGWLKLRELSYGEG